MKESEFITVELEAPNGELFAYTARRENVSGLKGIVPTIRITTLGGRYFELPKEQYKFIEVIDPDNPRRTVWLDDGKAKLSNEVVEAKNIHNFWVERFQENYNVLRAKGGPIWIVYKEDNHYGKCFIIHRPSDDEFRVYHEPGKFSHEIVQMIDRMSFFQSVRLRYAHIIKGDNVRLSDAMAHICRHTRGD